MYTMDEQQKIDSIVISGGGLHGIMILGALQCAIDSNLINMAHIDMLVGTSVGSIISYMLIIGLFPTEIIIHLVKYKDELNDMANQFNMLKMFKLQGGLSFSAIQSILEQITLDKTGTLYTMKSLYDKYKKTLVCVTYNYTLKTIEYITHDNFPGLPCILAIKMSCCIPIIFEKCMYNDNQYIDGGVYDNLAIQYPLQCEKLFPIAFNIQYVYNEQQENTKINLYLYELYKIVINSGGYHKCEMFKDKVKIIKIQPPTANPLWNSDMTIIDLLEMFSNGYKSLLM